MCRNSTFRLNCSCFAIENTFFFNLANLKFSRRGPKADQALVGYEDISYAEVECMFVC